MATSRLLLGRPRAFPLRTCARKQYFYTANGFRPRSGVVINKFQTRKATFEAGEDETGHIATAKNEGIFFFDSMVAVAL